MVEWFLALGLIDQLGIVLGALDITLGALPDKIIKWPGLILSVGHKLHQYGKEVTPKPISPK